MTPGARDWSGSCPLMVIFLLPNCLRGWFRMMTWHRSDLSWAEREHYDLRSHVAAIWWADCAPPTIPSAAWFYFGHRIAVGLGGGGTPQSLNPHSPVCKRLGCDVVIPGPEDASTLPSNLTLDGRVCKRVFILKMADFCTFSERLDDYQFAFLLDMRQQVADS